MTVRPGARIAIVHTQWNAAVVDALVSGAKEELLRRGVKADSIFVRAVRLLLCQPKQRRLPLPFTLTAFNAHLLHLISHSSLNLLTSGSRSVRVAARSQVPHNEDPHRSWHQH